MSSPARSVVSGGGGGGGSNASYGEDVSGYPFYPDIISALDRKDEALAALKSDLTAALQKEVKSLDEDAWKFARPRSQIHRISKRGGHLQNLTQGRGS